MPDSNSASGTSLDRMLDWVLVSMGSSVDFLLKLNATCVDCFDQGPPPNTILDIPPPPLPLFLQRAFNNNADPCTIQCDWNTGPGIEYVELPRQVVTGPVIDDTWLLVLIASCIGVLLVGVLIVLFFVKSRVERSGKGGLQLDVPSSLSKTKGGIKGCEAVLYPCTSSNGAITPDSRILWAALTPRGTTQHFTTEPPIHQKPYVRTSPPLKPQSLPPLPRQPVTGQLIDVPAFDNSGFVDSDDPMYSEPLTPVYCEPILLNGMVEASSSSNTLKRCATLRPTVSSPTRIEHPNLPPLNMMHNHRSLRRATLSRKDSDLSPTPALL